MISRYGSRFNGLVKKFLVFDCGIWLKNGIVKKIQNFPQGEIDAARLMGVIGILINEN